MRQLRGLPEGTKDTQLLSGPAKLTKGLGIDLAFNEVTFASDHLRLFLPAGEKPIKIGMSGRIGITKAADLKLR